MLPSIGCKPSIFVPFGFSLVIQDIFHSWVCQFDSIMWQTKPTECDVLIPRWKLSSDSWMWRCVIVNLVNCVIDRQSVQKKKIEIISQLTCFGYMRNEQSNWTFRNCAFVARPIDKSYFFSRGKFYLFIHFSCPEELKSWSIYSFYFSTFKYCLPLMTR